MNVLYIYLTHHSSIQLGRLRSIVLQREVLAKLNSVYFTVEVNLRINDMILNRKEEENQGKKKTSFKNFSYRVVD